MRHILALAFLSLAACNGSGSHDTPGTAGTAGEQQYDISGFTGIESQGASDVSVKTGGAFSVRATGAKKDIDRLDIRRDGSNLLISAKHSSWGSYGDTHVYVTMPTIARASNAGSGDIAIDRVEGYFQGSVSGSGDMALPSVQADRLGLSISGSGDIDAAGSSNTLTASVSGSGDINASRLTTGQATVSITGSGDVDAKVDGDATVSLMGSGDANMGSKARCRVTSNGSGSANCG